MTRESVQSELFDLQDELCESGQVTSRTIDDPEADCRTSGLYPRVELIEDSALVLDINKVLAESRGVTTAPGRRQTTKL